MSDELVELRKLIVNTVRIERAWDPHCTAEIDDVTAGRVARAVVRWAKDRFGGVES